MDHTNNTALEKVGFVVIGRNEGERLQACLSAIKQLCANSTVVYVDSGSTDDSVSFAKSLDYHVVELDLSIPFTAARARNAGFSELAKLNQHIKYVQFLDGDCELQPGWIESAVTALDSSSDVGIVSGRRAEKYKDATIYNTLMDIEWDTPIGEARAVPGDMCVKISLFKQINGFTENIISAEDDDFCIRARSNGYRVLRLDILMTFHDANITKIGQWYKRSKRGGHGYANINHLHGQAPEFYFRRELRSVVFWGGVFPALLVLSLFTHATLTFVLISIYLLFIVKTVVRKMIDGCSAKVSFAYGYLIYSGKIAELLGILQYWKTHITSGQHKLIEYK
jgi:GT2 family glycosyltransferase